MTDERSISSDLKALNQMFGGFDTEARRNATEIGPPSFGAILDEFSMQCFKPEASIWPISVRDTTLALDILRPEFMLIESAWNGNDGDWQYQITGPNGPKESYSKLISALKEREIPSIFWNKEDPPHFQEFLPAARAADFIFTCEESLIPAYVREAGHSNVNVLRFAAQPIIHTPFRQPESRTGNIAFAGQYFAHKFPERRQQMETLFPAATRLGLSIYSRVLHGDPNYAFPEPYSKNIVGSLPYSEMVKAYRDHKIFLNVNSVPESKSMCARRIFELSASKTAVVSAPTEAISGSYASDEVFTAGTPTEAESILTKLVNEDSFRERSVHRAWRKTLSEHTYRNRLSEIRSVIGLERPRETDSVIAVCVVSSITSFRRILRDIEKQTMQPSSILYFVKGSPSRELLKEFTQENWGDAVKAIHSISTISTDSSVAGTAWVTIFSEAFEYGSNYLNDFILYQQHFNMPGIVAKGVTMSSTKNASDFVGDRWPEDIMTNRILTGAWLAPSSSDWKDLVSQEIYNSGGYFETSDPVNVSDRFNIREYNTVSMTDWEV